MPTPDDAFHWRVPFIDGDLVCEVSGEGRPILLVHSINAAASACEMAALARELRRARRVYNLNLPGFGASARPDVRYDVPRFVAAIEAVAAAIRHREATDQPLDAVALSLSSEFLARSAVRQPSSYRKLAFITPTGFQRGAEKLRREEGRRWRGAGSRPLSRAVRVPCSSGPAAAGQHPLLPETDFRIRRDRRAALPLRGRGFPGARRGACAPRLHHGTAFLRRHPQDL